jgi:hypothetical protein
MSKENGYVSPLLSNLAVDYSKRARGVGSAFAVPAGECREAGGEICGI